MTVTRKWSLLAAVLVLAILVAGWFLLIAPKRGDAAVLRDQTVSQKEANARLVQQLEVLQAQQAELPRQRALLAVMRTQIPNNPALPTLIRDLTAAGRKVGVSLDTLTPSVPVAAVAAQPTAASPAAESGESSEGATGTTPAATAASTLYQVPLTLNVTGSYFELEQFINKLEGLKRSFLVNGFTVAEATGEDASEGDLGLTLQGRVFLSPPAPAATTPTTPVASAPAAQ
ncbi:MAG: type 4a pilus biogenesis protein PilO [Actinomycetes bacterium]